MTRTSLLPALLMGFGFTLTPLACAIASPQAATSQATAQAWNIPAGALSTALARFGDAATVLIVYDPAQVEGRQSAGLQGSFSVAEGLARLLAGSGLQAVAAERGYTLSSAPPASDATDEVRLPVLSIQATQGGAEAASRGYRGAAAGSTTRLGLSDRQTPQAITTVTRQQLDDFRLNSVKEALRSAPSVMVEQFETDRTAFTSRGFNIENFEFDGMGQPFSSGVLLGDQDMSEFEQIDVLHGANGLMSGAGNPSATVNFVRKRPTDTFQARLGASAGSWDNRRVDADLSGPLSESGNLRGRLVMAHDKGNSYLDRYSHEANTVAGTLALDLSDADTLTVGFSQQNSDANGSSWGALPMADYAGNRLHYSDRSASTAQPWTYWNIHTQRGFAELAHQFDNGWAGKLTVTGVSQHQDTKMFYAIPRDAQSLYAYINRTTSSEHQLLGEGQLSGPFTLLGREHSLTLGAAYGRTHHDETGHYKDANGYEVVSFVDALAGAVPQPDLGYTDALNTQLFTDRQKSLYAGARFSLADDLHWIAGARMLSADSDGAGYGAPHQTRVHGEVTPYTGLVYDLTAQWSLYGSWTKIFKPQYVLGSDGRLLAPLDGKSLEAGLKGNLLEDRLKVTAAVFKTEQRNVPQATGALIGSQYAYQGMDYRSHGIELEASGEVAMGLDLAAGYTFVRIDNDEGEHARKYVPTHSLRGSLTYRLPALPQARIGGRVRWQSGTELDSSSTVRQNAYALLDLMASYDIDAHWSTSLNLNNVTDRKYLLSLYQSAGSTNYGAPRNLMASVTWKY